jgi:hypothetical protein
MKRNIESIVFTNAVKKDRMRELINYAFVGSKATKINVYIDLYPIIRSMYADSYQVVVDDYIGLSAYLINLCGHYRSFFKYFYRVDTVFYLVMGKNCPGINNQLVPNYNAVMNNRLMGPIRSAMDEISNTNIGILNILCPYLPDIHFIRSIRNYEVAVIIADIIEKLNDGQPNLIISKDLYPLQLCYMYPYTSYLYPRKTRTEGDMSIMVPILEKTQEFRYQFWNIVAERRKIKVDSLLNINPVNFTLYSAMTRFPERNVLPITRTQAEAVKFILKLGGDRLPVLPSQLDYDQEISMAIPTSIVQARYKALDVQYILQFYREDVECRDIKIQNLDDNGTIANINAKYFGNNPIDINRL